MAKSSNKTNFLPWRFFNTNLPSLYQNCLNFHVLGSKLKKSFCKLSKNQENDQIFTFSKFGRHLLHTVWSKLKLNFSLNSPNPPGSHNIFWVPHGVHFDTMTMVFSVTPIKPKTASGPQWSFQHSPPFPFDLSCSEVSKD